MSTYFPPAYNPRLPTHSIFPHAGSRHGGGHFGGLAADSNPPRHLIVSVTNNPAGRRALTDLAEAARELGLIWLGTLREQLERAGVESAARADELPHRFALLEIESGSEAQALRDLFRFECRRKRRGDDQFLSVEPDYPLRYFTPTKIGSNFDLRASGSSHDFYARMLKISDAHNNGTHGQGVVVAVVDSGIEKTGIASTFKDLQTPANHTEIDNNGHGTAMASIIGDLAPQASVAAIRICDGFPRMWKLMLGISCASMAHHADIINLSLGLDSIPTACTQCGASSPGLSNNLEYFLDGISRMPAGSNQPPLLVASTGNDSLSAGFSYPAKWHFTVAVGAMNSAKARSRFSNYGATSHPAFFVMPGGDDDAQGNPSEWTGKGDDAECLGTSPAAAYASAMLALYGSDPDYQNSDRSQFLSGILNNCDSTFAGHQAAEHGLGFLPYVKKK